MKGLRKLPSDRLWTQKFSSSFQRGLEAISRVLLLRLIAVKHSQSYELETASFRSFSQFADYLSRATTQLNFYGLASDWIFSSANLEKGSRVFDLKQCEVTDMRTLQQASFIVLTLWMCVGTFLQRTECAELWDRRAFYIPFVVSGIYIYHLMMRNLSRSPLLSCWYANAHFIPGRR